MKKSKKEAMALVVAATVSTVGASGAKADVVYSYTGNDFNSFSTPALPYTTSDFVSLTLTLSAPLGDKLTNASVTPISFTISDGVDTLDITSAPLTDDTFQFSTSSNGTITGWDIDVIRSPSISDQAISSLASTTPSSNAIDMGMCFICDLGKAPGTYIASGTANESRGNWAVPGPTIGAGIPGLMFACGLLIWWRIRRPCGIEPPLTIV
jgi:hypothetical protein